MISVLVSVVTSLLTVEVGIPNYHTRIKTLKVFLRILEMSMELKSKKLEKISEQRKQVLLASLELAVKESVPDFLAAYSKRLAESQKPTPEEYEWLQEAVEVTLQTNVKREKT
jgi:hypothetical protein